MHKAKKVGILAAVLLVIAAIIGSIYYMQSWPLRFHSTFDRFFGDGNWELISAETKTSLMYEVYYRMRSILGRTSMQNPLKQVIDRSRRHNLL